MALLTEKEQVELRAKGCWVKERCDRAGCVNIIGWLSWTGRGDFVYCSEVCRDSVDGQRVKRKPRAEGEAVSSAPKMRTKRSGGEKLLGVAPVGTTLANILTVLLDNKWHTKDSLSECKVKSDDSIGWRLTMLQRAGETAEQPFELELVKDKARLTFTAKSMKPIDLGKDTDYLDPKSKKTKDLVKDEKKLDSKHNKHSVVRLAARNTQQAHVQNMSKATKKFKDAPVAE